jgi:hypothetical protein
LNQNSRSKVKITDETKCVSKAVLAKRDFTSFGTSDYHCYVEYFIQGHVPVVKVTVEKRLYNGVVSNLGIIIIQISEGHQSFKEFVHSIISTSECYLMQIAIIIKCNVAQVNQAHMSEVNVTLKVR